MTPEELAKLLLASFVEELATHVASLERDLLALERGDAAGPQELLHALFRTIHTIKGASRAAGVELVEQTTHRVEDVLSKLREGTITAGPAIFELLFGVTDALRDAADRLKSGSDLDGSILAAFLARFDAVDDAPLSMPQVTAHATSRETGLRISAERVDTLLAISNELGVAYRRLAAHEELFEALREIAPRDVLAVLDRHETLQSADRRRLGVYVRELDTKLRQLRMIRFGDACRGLDRAARDVAHSVGKEVDIVIHGEGVELDRDVVEGIRGPLLHLVRNAVDHGIESPDTRAAVGKSVRGTITVSATLLGGEVSIRIADDGGGLDLDAIRSSLRKRRIPEPVHREDLLQSIFLAGFSTAPLVTDVSGRGVGLDVVKRSIESMMGAVELSFRPNDGTVFTLRVPVTRSSMRALFVRCGDRVWAIPSIAVKRLVRVGANEIHPVAGVETISVDGSPIPIVPLAVALGELAKPQLDGVRASLVIVSAQGAEAALVVDELLEEREIVVKPLGPRLAASVWVSGATVLPNGRLSLVLSVAALVSHARSAARIPLFEAAKATAAVRTVLLVDDSLTTRILERSILESAGFVVIVAGDGVEAWELLQDRQVDLVVSDVEMPRMNGFELTEAIRKSNRFRELPVVLVTALATQEDRTRGLDAGASAYLVKSAFDQQNLLETIGQLL